MSSNPSKTTAEDLAREAREMTGPLSGEALQLVKDVLSSNDAEPDAELRIKFVRVASVLRAEHGVDMQPDTLRKLVCRALKRRSWSQS